jgi:hypothetical protein
VTDQAVLDRPEPAPVAQAPAAATARDPVWVSGLVWAIVAGYLIAMTGWAYHAGMKIRADAWANTHSIRFNGDIANGVMFGTQVLRTAERVANTNSKTANHGPPLVARAAPNPAAKNQRALTFWEIVRGEDQLYKDYVLNESPEGNFGVDYPPLRLLTMSLWCRHMEQRFPTLQSWPQRREQIHYGAGGDPMAFANENVAQPMLDFNAYSIAAAAVFAFFLVWIWTNRGGRPALPDRRTGWSSWFMPARRLTPWKPTLLRNANGLLIFPIAASAFFYAVVIAENPAPAPPPSVAFAGRPILSRGAQGTYSATVTATINSQGADSQWHVDWGTSPFYDRHTPDQSVDDSQDSGARLTNLPANTLIHYRLTARNDRGVTHSNDATFYTSDTLPSQPSRQVYGAVWLSWTHWIGIALLFGAMACSIRYLPPEHRGWAAGLVAALFIWFDPSIIMDTHVWPQWDAWVLPPFLLATLLATVDWWFTAGLVLGVGVMFKGQTMVAAPFLFLWPIFAGRVGAAARIIIGFVLSAGLVLSPWLVLDNAIPDWSVGPLRWIPGVLVGAIIAGCLSFYRQPVWRRSRAVWAELKDEWHGRATPPDNNQPKTSIFDLAVFCTSLLLGIVCITILILRRWPADSDMPRWDGLFLLLAVLIPPWFLPRRAMGFWLMAILGSTLWMSAYLYHGDWSWKTVGFEYGTRKHPQMALGQGGMGNLPQILETRFGWDIGDTATTIHPPDIAHALHLPASWVWLHTWNLDGTAMQVDIRTFLILIFGLVIFTAAAAAALQSRRNDPRFLAALAAIWVLMPNILCQMAARYQIWGAAISSLLIAISPGLTILHIVISLLAAGMVAAQLLGTDPGRSPLIHDIMARFHPDDGWIMLTIGLVFLYVAVIPARRAPRQELLPP